MQNDTGSALVYVVFVIPLFREGLSGLILFFGVLMAMLFVFSLVYPPLSVLLGIIVLAFLAYLIIKRTYKTILKPIALLLGVGGLVGVVLWILKKDEFLWYDVVLWSSVITAIVLLVYAIIKRIPQAPLVISIFLMSVIFTFGVDFAFHNLLEEHHRDRINNLLGIEIGSFGSRIQC